jgi:hypothetical protein
VLAALWAGAAAAAGWVTVDPATGQCATTHPPRHRLEVVTDTFAKKDDVAAAEAALRRRAVKALLDGAAAGRSPAEREAIRAATGVQVAVDLERRVLCAAALVASDVVADPSGAQVHEAAVAAAARGLAQSLQGAPLGALEVRWASGCGAGGPGARLRALLREGVVAAGGRVVEGEGDRAQAVLSPGDPTAIELWRYPRGGGAGELVATARVSPGWLGLHGAVGDQCHGAANLGGAAGQRPGAGGLRVELALDVGAGLCVGERAAAALRPSAAAAVQLWSVGRSGEAWLTWSSAAGGGPTDRRVRLELEAAYVPALGEEQLVALAAADPAALPPGAVGCRLKALPAPGPAVAVAAAPFTVHPPGADRCPALAPAGPDWGEWQGAPACK